ncbi:MAG: hypothetical protein WAK19_05585 [Candidatus Cybelea sp.]
MRDIGILIWVALLIVGVVGSMTSRIRSLRQAQGQRAPQPSPVPRPMQTSQRTQPFSAQMARPAATPSRTASTRPVPARQPAAAPSRVGPDPAQAAHPGTRTAARRLFGDRRDLVRAVIAAEVLGKPRAFSDE